MTAMAIAAAPLAQAAIFTWTGAGADTNWTTGGNWGGTAPANTGTDTLRFGGNTNLVTNNDFTSLSVIAASGSAIGFTNTSNVTGGAFTLNGNAITLGGSIVATAVTTGSLTDIINLQLNVAATRTITTQASHNLTINGQINETTVGAGGITKTGGALLTLSNATNNFTALTVTQGTLSVNSIANSGTASAIGSGSTITLGGATTEGIFTFTGADPLMASTNRGISLVDGTVGGRINSSGTTPLLFNGSFAASGNTNRTMTLGGANAGANEFQNTLVNPGTGKLTVVKTDAGAWTLSGPNTYTGNTNINGGTLNVATIADSGSSNLGLGTLIRIGAAGTTGTLNYTGTGSTTSRTVQIGNNTGTPAAGDTGGATINNNGSGALIFTATNFNTTGLTGSLAPSRSLTLGGDNADANEIQGVIANGLAGTMTTVVVKSDAGTWTLSGANTYTGQTQINNGTLNAATIADSGSSNLGLGTSIRFGNGTNTGTLNYTGAGSTTSRTVTIGNGTAVADNGGATINNNGSGALVFTAANFNTTGLTGGANTRTLTLGGSHTGANEIQGIIADSNNGTGKLTNLVKSGDGTWMLSGGNTYTGSTVVNAGTLKLGASNVIPDTNVTIGSNNATVTTSTLDLNGFSDTIAALTLGRGTTTVAGATASVVNNGGGSPVLTLGGALTYNTGSVGFLNGQATISANIDTGGVNRSIIVGDGIAAVDLVISGAISGAGNLTKTGIGVLQLSGANTNTGNLIVQDGTVQLGASNVLTDTAALNVGSNASAAGTTFDLNGFSDTVFTLSLGGAAATTAGLTHSIVNTGGTGVLTLGGTLTYNAGGASLNGQATISANLASGAATRNFNVGDGSATDDLVIAGALQAGGGFNVNGGGTMRLDNAANSHGTSQISGGSTLKLGANSVLGTGSVNLNQGVAGTSTLDINGKTDAVGTALSLSNATTTTLGAINQIIDSAGGGVLQLNGPVTYNAGATGFNNGTTTISASLDLNGALRNFNINDSDQVVQDVIISGVIQNSLGTAGISKNNAGTLVLTGANTYNGATTVTAGILEVNNTSGSGTGSGSVTVTSTLIGDGSITAASGNLVVINGSLIVGSTGATAGTDFAITTSGVASTIMGSTSFLNLDLWSSTGTDQTGILPAADMLRLFGSFDITAGATLKLNNPNALTFQAGDMFRLFDWAGLTTRTGTFTEDFSNITLSPGLSIDSSNLYTLGTISILGVPEPSRALLLLGGLGSVLLRRRRR